MILALTKWTVAPFLCGLLLTGAAHAEFTRFKICNRSSETVYLAIYGNPASSGYSYPEQVVGWRELGKWTPCYEKTIELYAVRSYAFAVLDAEDRFVPLEYDFGLQWASTIRGSARSICVPVQKTLEDFENTSRPTPPCADDHVAIPVSLSYRGGNDFRTDRRDVSHPGWGRLPEPDEAYMRIWDRKFGEPEAEENPPATSRSTGTSGKGLFDLFPRKDETAPKKPDRPGGDDVVGGAIYDPQPATSLTPADVGE